MSTPVVRHDAPPLVVPAHSSSPTGAGPKRHRSATENDSGTHGATHAEVRPMNKFVM
jgi:hypothetical protein